MKIDYSSTHIGKVASLTKIEKDLLLAENQRLRDEVNRTIDRMSRNEVVSAGFVFSLVFFHHQVDHSQIVPDSIIGWSAAILALLIACFGKQRSDVFRRHMDMVETYLSDMESRLSDTYGWTNFYEAVASVNSFDRQSGTRKIFWHVVRAFAFANIVLSVPALSLWFG